MTAERWARITELFRATLEKPAGERAAFLQNACGSDAALLRDIERLLAGEAEPSLPSPMPEFLANSAIELAPGDMLAHYRVEAKRGEGGMGAVYSAYDTRLRRKVALKTLPPDALGDPDRMGRLLREARAASALNHPNIVTIYEVGADRDVDFIAMELVSGKTLAQLIGRNGMPLRDALNHAVRIASALAAAHRAGIVHRDLKPANIMVNDAGQVKVLDFGLAKRTERAAGEETDSTHAMGPETVTGTVLGTVAYMSPEQAEGKKLDARSDIFSFGVVLYEMVTGKRAFERDSTAATLAAILKEEPKPPGEFAGSLPLDLEKVLTRCLRKDPARRFQHMEDVEVALEELKEGGSPLPPENRAGKVAAPGPAAARFHRAPTLWVSAAVGLLLVVGIGTWMRFRLPTAPRAVPKTVPLTTYPGSQFDPALSPDGKQVAFAWDGEQGENSNIYVKLVDGGKPLRLTTNPADERSPAWSPDGAHIAFLRYLDSTADILVVSSLGGQERRVGQVAITPFYFYSGNLSWSPDGKFLAVVDGAPNESAGIYFVSLETWQKHRMTSTPREYAGDYFPRFAPDGKSLAFARSTGDIYVLPLTTDGSAASAPQRITSKSGDIGGLDWTPDGRNLVFSLLASSGFALRLIPAAGGEPEPLVGAGQGGYGPSISRNANRLAYVRSTEDYNIWRIPGPRSNARTVSPEKWIASTERDCEPQYSPDGKKILFSSRRSGTQELWTCDSRGGEAVQLTSLGSHGPGTPRWSPDSRWIAFDGNGHIFIISADGGAARQLTRGNANNVRPSWSADGKWVYFGSNRSGEWQIWKAPALGGDARQVTKGGGREAIESLDGKLLFYAKYPEPGIWSVPVEGGEETQILRKAGQSIWGIARDGICFFDWKDALHPLMQFYSFRDRRSTTLYEFPRGTRLEAWQMAISVSPDERWVLYTQIDNAGSNLVLIENFR